MATVIDALLITLGLDPAGFKKGIEDSKKAIKPLTDEQKKQATEETRQFKVREEQARKTAQGISKVRDGVIALTAAYIGGSAIKSFVERITGSDAKLGFFSRNLGMSTRELSMWQGVAEKTGGSAQGLAADFQGITQALQRFSLTGQGGESFKYFRSIGVNLTDMKGNARSMTDVMLEVADRFAGMDPMKAQALGAGMGFSEGTVNVLMHGRVALQAYLETQKQLNVVSAEDAKNAQARTKAWKELADRFESIGRVILNDLSPALVGLLNFIRDHAPAAAALMGALAIAFTSMSVVRFAGVLSGLAQLTTGIAAASAASTGLIAGLGALGLLGAAGAAGYLLGNALGLGKGGEILGGWLYDKMHPGSAAATGGKRAVAGTAPAAGGASSGSKAMFAGLEKQFGLPEGLLDSVWKQESNRGKNMRSPAGAMGHFQFMPVTARKYGVSNPDDLSQSARGAAAMFSDLLRQYGGNLPKALAAYNMGSGNLARRGMGNLTAETQKYIPQVMARMRGSQQSASTSTTDVKVGSITVNTQATDAKGIATDIGASMKQYAFATQANTGLN